MSEPFRWEIEPPPWPYGPPSPLPQIAPGQRRCRWCQHGIEQYDGLYSRFWSTPVGAPPAPGMVLGMSCPGRPLHDGYGNYDRHEPE